MLVDEHGVPAVYARDEEDVFFAAGVLHARDRLWQMELYRRVTLGRLSEVLGDDTIDVDKRFLTLGLRDAARAEWDRAPTQVRTSLERYAAGVNAYIASVPGTPQRPLEFQILGFMPAPWEPLDSLAVGRLLAWRLAENHQAELVRAAIAAKFGAEAALLLSGRYPANAPAILDGPRPPAIPPTTACAAATGQPPSSAQRPPSPPARKMPAGLEWLSASARRANSNNWVLANRRTKAGRPILANDPHLQIEFPVGVVRDAPGRRRSRCRWRDHPGCAGGGAGSQRAHRVGHDQHRRRRAGSRDRAHRCQHASGSFHRGEWVPIEIVKADIPVRGRSQPLPFEVWKTRNGPIVAEVGMPWDAPPSWLSPDDRPAEERRAYSLRWDVSGDLATAFDAHQPRHRLGVVHRGGQRFLGAVTNIVYADIDGNIGYAMSGRLPIRASGDGRMPVDGSAGTAWTGSIDPSTLPRVLNPDAGFISSSNNLVDRRLPAADHQ